MRHARQPFLRGDLRAYVVGLFTYYVSFDRLTYVHQKRCKYLYIKRDLRALELLAERKHFVTRVQEVPL
jgi:hypothetical protein